MQTHFSLFFQLKTRLIEFIENVMGCAVNKDKSTIDEIEQL